MEAIRKINGSYGYLMPPSCRFHCPESRFMQGLGLLRSFGLLLESKRWTDSSIVRRGQTRSGPISAKPLFVAVVVKWKVAQLTILSLAFVALAACNSAHGDPSATEPPVANIVTTDDPSLFTVSSPNNFLLPRLSRAARNPN